MSIVATSDEPVTVAEIDEALTHLSRSKLTATDRQLFDELIDELLDHRLTIAP